MRARWLPSHVPDSVFSSSFVADCVFAVLATMAQNILAICKVFDEKIAVIVTGGPSPEATWFDALDVTSPGLWKTSTTLSHLVRH